MSPSVEYLGYQIDKIGLHPTDDKVKAVKDAPPPKNAMELRSFLRLIDYYGKFLPNLSSVSTPLLKQLKTDSKWTWKYPQVTAFNSAKCLLQLAPVHIHYDNVKEVVLAYDTSLYGVGAALSHCLIPIRPVGKHQP